MTLEVLKVYNFDLYMSKFLEYRDNVYIYLCQNFEKKIKIDTSVIGCYIGRKRNFLKSDFELSTFKPMPYLTYSFYRKYI